MRFSDNWPVISLKAEYPLTGGVPPSAQLQTKPYCQKRSRLVKLLSLSDSPTTSRISTFSWPVRDIWDGLWFSLILGLLTLASPLSAVSLGELQHTKNLTPKKFAGFFELFDFELHKEIQPAHKFLMRQRGDCDDYAVLADHILPAHGYETRLVHVRLAGQIAHAVCFITEDGVYLDFNNRNVFFSVARSSPDLRTIAEKVARSLNANWTSASEFVFSYETEHKVVTATVARTADPSLDPAPRKASAADSGFQVD